MVKKWAGITPGPYYTSEHTNAARIPYFPATNAAFAIVYLYPPHYKLWSPSQCSMALLSQRVSVRLLLCRMLEIDFGAPLPDTSVNKGKNCRRWWSWSP